MGQKVNPHGLRVGIIKDWDSKWFADKKDFGDCLVEDYNIRKYLKKALYDAGVEKIIIEKKAKTILVSIYAARPGFIIGRGGKDIDVHKAKLEKMTGKKVHIDIVEIKNADLSAQIVAENIAQQLEKRISFRRAMKQCMGRAMRSGAKGIKTMCSGRLGGAEIARSEQYHEGTIPLQTLRADIDYGFAEADTTYGKIGCKVWIYKGEILNAKKKIQKVAAPVAAAAPAVEAQDNNIAKGGEANVIS
jgi:small subunit ribosomal protein S3